VTLASFAMALDALGDHAGRLWRMVAFLGRYGHQPADVCLRMPVDDLQRLAREVGKILEEEQRSIRR